MEPLASAARVMDDTWAGSSLWLKVSTFPSKITSHKLVLKNSAQCGKNKSTTVKSETGVTCWLAANVSHVLEQTASQHAQTSLPSLWSFRVRYCSFCFVFFHRCYCYCYLLRTIFCWGLINIWWVFKGSRVAYVGNDSKLSGACHSGGDTPWCKATLT